MSQKFIEGFFPEFQEEKETDADIIYPLLPNDPAAGLIEGQGHYILHFAFFIAITLFVEKQEEFSYCFTQTEKY